MSTASFLTFATLLVLMTLSWSQPGKAAPTSNDSNQEAEAEAEAERASEKKKDIREVFRVLDQDGDGYVSAAEFLHMMNNFKPLFNKTEKEVNEMFEKLDIDDDGQINDEEFDTAMMSHDEQMKSLWKGLKYMTKLWAIFIKFLDKDGNGYLSKAKLMTISRKTDKEVDEIIQKLDIDDDGQVNFKEFVPVMMRIFRPRGRANEDFGHDDEQMKISAMMTSL